MNEPTVIFHRTYRPDRSMIVEFVGDKAGTEWEPTEEDNDLVKYYPFNSNNEKREELCMHDCASRVGYSDGKFIVVIVKNCHRKSEHDNVPVTTVIKEGFVKEGV